MTSTVTVGQEKGKPVEIFFKDWGSGQPVVISIGWPLNAYVWVVELM